MEKILVPGDKVIFTPPGPGMMYFLLPTSTMVLGMMSSAFVFDATYLKAGLE